ncbi:MAG: hypothetical protein ACOYT7_03300 [Patescibacteria group bacterium]
MYEPVHIHRSSLNRDLNVFLLFIPAIIFVLVIAFLLTFKSKEEIATTAEPSILGEETEKISP